MDDFERLQCVYSCPERHFNVFQARTKKQGKRVVLQTCEFQEPSDCEPFLKHHLQLARNKQFTAPLIAVIPDIEQTTQKATLNFVWEKGGDALDPEIIADFKSQASAGKKNFTQKKTVWSNPHTGVLVKEAFSETFEEGVMLEIFTSSDLRGLSNGFSEALAQARCSHPNLCSFLDICFFKTKNQRLRLILIIEKLENDLETEFLSRQQPLREESVWRVLLNVSEGLLWLKEQGSENVANITPSSIMCSRSGQYKLSHFNYEWQRSLHQPQNSFSFISPEAVFSLGVTMLHLASMKILPHSSAETVLELETLIREEISSLACSEDLKEVLVRMMESDPQSRVSLEDIHEKALRKDSLQEAKALTEEANSLKQLGQLEAAAAKYALAHEIYGRLPTHLETADNLHAWGMLLKEMNQKEEALAKYKEADQIYSRLFPTHLNTGVNIRRWGIVYRDMGEKERACEKYEAADALLQRYYPTDLHTAHNLFNWAGLYREMENYTKAEEKRIQADAVYSLYFPSTIFNADNLHYWGILYKDMGRFTQACEKHSEAHAIYSLNCPLPMESADNLSNWAKVLRDMGEKAKASEKFAEADAVYMQRDARHIDTATNLKVWADFLKDTEQYELAMQKYASAHAIYSQCFPTHRDTASNLGNWGLLYRNMGQVEEALQKIAEADALLSGLYPTEKNTAVNLRNWADTLLAADNRPAALEKYRAAEIIFCALAPADNQAPLHLSDMADKFGEAGEKNLALEFKEKALALYEQHHPTIVAYADCLASTAILLDDIGDKGKALQKYAMADTQYKERFPSNKNTASNLWNWGLLLAKIRQETEAIPKIQQALVVYDQLNENENSLACQQFISKMEANLSSRAVNSG